MSDHPLKEWREQNGMSQGALAEKVDVWASHISQIEGGLRVPSLGLASRLSEITGIPIEKFVARPKSEAAA